MVLASKFNGEPVPALTSDPAYSGTLFPEPFVMGEGVSYAYALRKVGRVIEKF